MEPADGFERTDSKRQPTDYKSQTKIVSCLVFSIYLEFSVDIRGISRCSEIMIERDRELNTLRRLLRRHPVVGIIGAHQVGKTTLARFPKQAS